MDTLQNTPELLADILVDAPCARILAFNPTGTHLAVGHVTGELTVWDLLTKSRVRHLSVYGGACAHVVWSGDSSVVTVGSMAGSITCVEVGSLENTHVIEVHCGSMMSSLASYGDSVCAGTMTGITEWAELSLGSESSRDAPVELGDGPYVVQYLPSGVLAAAATRQNTFFLLSRLQRMGQPLTLPGGKVERISAAHQQPMVAVQTPDTVHIILCDGAPILVRSLTDPVNHLTFCSAGFSHSVGDYLWAVSRSSGRQEILTWTVEGMFLGNMVGPPDLPHDADYSPVEAMLAVLDETGRIGLWAKNWSDFWVGFYPNFRECQSNELYEEAEDEFDLHERQTINKVRSDVPLELVTPVEEVRFSLPVEPLPTPADRLWSLVFDPDPADPPLFVTLDDVTNIPNPDVGEVLSLLRQTDASDPQIKTSMEDLGNGDVGYYDSEDEVVGSRKIRG